MAKPSKKGGWDLWRLSVSSGGLLAFRPLQRTTNHWHKHRREGVEPGLREKGSTSVTSLLHVSLQMNDPEPHGDDGWNRPYAQGREDRGRELGGKEKGSDQDEKGKWHGLVSSACVRGPHAVTRVSAFLRTNGFILQVWLG